MRFPMSTLRWGILGTGAIAKTFVEGLRSSASGRLIAVASRDGGKAAKFIADHAAGTNAASHGSYEALLADSAVDAVYVSTPHPQHAEWAIKAARAKKHVLCEKPLAPTYAQAVTMVDAARESGVFLMEAFMYRCHPQTARLVELIRAKTIGDVRLIQAAFGFRAPFDAQSRMYKHAHAGGGILDVGCYPVSMARLIAGVATDNDFADPLEVKGMGHLGQTGVDEYATALLRFPGDILATVATGVALEEDNTVRILGTEGQIFVSHPWVPAREGGKTEIIVQRTGEPAQSIEIDAGRHLYAYEIDQVAEAVDRLRTSPGDALRGQAAPPAMTWADTLGNIKTLDAWRHSFGFRYEFE
jgi:predicted dehydrogenase